MTTEQFKEKYKALQEEAKALANELKPIAKRYRSFCKKATALGYKGDNDAKLYKKNEERCGDCEPDGWSIHVLFRLTDFDGAEEWVQDACNVLLNLADQPFNERGKKKSLPS